MMATPRLTPTAKATFLHHSKKVGSCPTVRHQRHRTRSAPPTSRSSAPTALHSSPQATSSLGHRFPKAMPNMKIMKAKATTATQWPWIRWSTPSAMTSSTPPALRDEDPSPWRLPPRTRATLCREISWLRTSNPTSTSVALTCLYAAPILGSRCIKASQAQPRSSLRCRSLWNWIRPHQASFQRPTSSQSRNQLKLPRKARPHRKFHLLGNPWPQASTRSPWTTTSHHQHPTSTSSEPRCARTTSFTVNANTETR